MILFYGPLHMDMSVWGELIYINSVQTQVVVCKTCQEQWMIGMDRERKSGKSVLSL